MGRDAAGSVRRLAVALVVVGIAWRIAVVALGPDHFTRPCDGHLYWNLAQNLAAGRGLVVDDPTIPPECVGREPGPSHHYGPLMPAYEAAFLRVLGPSVASIDVALVVLSVGLVAAMYGATRDLWGRDAALLATGALALDWVGIHFGTEYGYAENLVQLTFLATLWAILRSLRNEAFLPLAGLFAGLGYLTKASMGWFFLLAAAGGLAWRLAYQGPRVFRSRPYLLGGLVFVAFVAAWAGRNLRLFWDGTPSGLLVDWQTSAYTASATAHAFQRPLAFAGALALKLPILVAAILVPYAWLAPELRASLPRWREEEASGLVLAVGLVFALGWVFAAVFWLVERTNPLWADAARYLSAAQVAILWLAVRVPPAPRAAARWAAYGATAVLLAFGMRYLLQPGAPLSWA